ncbi:MAG: hypothetical protein U0790_22840 [Isosphaeraceae bacterium]
MAPAEERHVARSWKPSMGISYIDYYLPESRVAIRDLVDREARADHSATRSHLSKYGERVEGSPASQLFAMHSNSNVFRTYRNTDRLEADIRQKWNIPYARVESGRTTLEAFKLLLDRFFDEAPVRPREINHLIYCSYNQNMYQADSACVPHELQEHYRMNRCTVTNVFRDCSSVMASIEYGESLIACGKAEHCLILCANFIEKMPRLLEFTVVSDAVALACLSRSAATAVLDHASLSTGTAREARRTSSPSPGSASA